MFNQLRSQRIALHISCDRQEVFIGLYGKRFEAALIDRAGPGSVVVNMPALRMRDRDPPQYLGEFSIMSRPEEEMPMIRHQTIGRDPYPGLGMSFSQNLLERGIVSRLLKQGEPPNPTVQDMIGEISSSEAWAAWHGRFFSKAATRLSRKYSRPLFLSLIYFILSHIGAKYSRSITFCPASRVSSSSGASIELLRKPTSIRLWRGCSSTLTI